MGLASDPSSRFYKVNSLGYQSSKASVNFATIIFSKELATDDITVNSVNPGWTATGFGGRPEDAHLRMQDVATVQHRSLKWLVCLWMIRQRVPLRKMMGRCRGKHIIMINR